MHTIKQFTNHQKKKTENKGESRSTQVACGIGLRLIEVRVSWRGHLWVVKKNKQRESRFSRNSLPICNNTTSEGRAIVSTPPNEHNPVQIKDKFTQLKDPENEIQ